MSHLNYLVQFGFETPAPRVRRAGVYFLIKRGTVIYVGSTSDVDMRLQAHSGVKNASARIRKRAWDSAAFIPLPKASKTVRLKIEAYFIFVLRPLNNPPRAKIYPSTVRTVLTKPPVTKKWVLQQISSAK